MSERTIVTIAEGPVTRLGQRVLAGEVIDAEPIMSSTLRVMDAYVLSVLIDGEGNYRDADGRDERLRPGAHTILPPGFPHTYHTDPGERWTELFVVFTGPLFDALAQLAGAGPRYPVPPPSIEALRTVLRSPPRTRRVPSRLPPYLSYYARFGVAASSLRVYGSLASPMTSSVGPRSTITPSFSTICFASTATGFTMSTTAPPPAPQRPHAQPTALAPAELRPRLRG